jgi:adenylate cyclase
MDLYYVIRKLLCGLIFVLPLCALAQPETTRSAQDVDSIFQRVISDQDMDSRTKSDLLDSAFQISLHNQDLCRQIQARIRQATHLDNIGMPDSALTQLYWASQAYQSKCDSNTLMMLFGNLTNVYLSLGELNRIDSVSRIALSITNPSLDKKPRFQILNNLAIAKATNGDMASATTTFRRAYQESSLDRDAEYIQKTLLNLGTLKGMTGDLDSATYFLTLAANNARVNEDIYSYMTMLVNLANVETEKGKYKNAIALLDSTYTMAEDRNYTEILAKVQKERALLYARMQNYKSAYDYLTEFIILNDKYLNEERVKTVTEMMEKYESEKKARQIQQLELDKLDATLRTERITNTRNRYMYIGLVVFVAAIGLMARLNYVRKSRAALQKEKDISEGLLLNILPASVAEELKLKGHAEAQHFDVATILFSDFKGFTTVSEVLNAGELVEEINACFKSFDEIMTRFGIEKIKTIGDAYMAAGGIPGTNTATALDVVQAALAMQGVIIERKRKRTAENLPAFEMRVGIHSGPVVAGIVGVKKFQYDIWGDTVNIASRMESSGEVGRVNISEATYQLVKDNPKLVITPRGMIHAKGKGEMAMYFVSLVDDNQDVSAS